MDYRALYDRDYIGHFDLPGGKDTTLTIKRVVGGELTAMGGRKSKKPIVHFASDVKPLICNKTNGKTIAGMYGNEVAQWAGKRVTLYVSMTRNPDGGGEVECIRIRPKIPSGKTDTPMEPRPEPEEHVIETAAPQIADTARPASGSTALPTDQSATAAATITAEEALVLEGRCSDNSISVVALKKAAKVERLALILADDLPRAHAWIDAVIEKRKVTA